MVADLGGKDGVVLPRAWHRTMSRANLPFSRCEVFGGTVPRVAWVGVCGKYPGVLPKAPVFQVSVEVWFL